MKMYPRVYQNPEIAKIRKWQRLALIYRRLYQDAAQREDQMLHQFLDSLGVPRSAYGYENVSDGSHARISHFIGYLQGKHPLKSKL